MDKLESEEHDFGTDPTVTRDIVTTLLPVGKLVGNWCLDLLGVQWTDLVKYLEESREPASHPEDSVLSRGV